MPEEFANVFFKQPAFALVIGISRYKNGVDMVEGDQVLESHQFPNLKLADKDARDFATFLKTHGFIGQNVRSLLNNEAGIDEIRGEFDELRKRCKSSGDEHPLVIVYFSGHGWADDDDEGSHYLVPWDAERHRLPTTALSNQTFSELIGRLKTNRLAVFLDACHAGAMGMSGARGAQPQYDFHKALGEGEGRYLIASCKRGQKSYELKPGGEHSEPKDNGIFTGHLLQLLKCETDDLYKEEIDIINLYDVLKDKVRWTAREQYGQDQEPQLDTKEGAGLILAINQRVKKRRLEADKEAHEKKRKFLSLIRAQIPVVGPQDKFSIILALQAYVESGRTDLEDASFYGVFDEQLRRWIESPDELRVQACCKFLIEAQKYASNAAPVSKESASQETKAVDKFEQTPDNKLLGGDLSQTVSTPTSPSDQQQARWKPSPEDRAHILEKIRLLPAYYEVTVSLRSMLNQRVSEADFMNKILELGENLEDGDELQVVLAEIVKRFREWWAKTNAPERLSDFLMKRR
jgi:caspase domain-containing protein